MLRLVLSVIKADVYCKFVRLPPTSFKQFLLRVYSVKTLLEAYLYYSPEREKENTMCYSFLRKLGKK